MTPRKQNRGMGKYVSGLNNQWTDFLNGGLNRKDTRQSHNIHMQLNVKRFCLKTRKRREKKPLGGEMKCASHIYTHVLSIIFLKRL